jgi:hypothetical protein
MSLISLRLKNRSVFRRVKENCYCFLRRMDQWLIYVRLSQSCCWCDQKINEDSPILCQFTAPHACWVATSPPQPPTVKKIYWEDFHLLQFVPRETWQIRNRGLKPKQSVQHDVRCSVEYWIAMKFLLGFFTASKERILSRLYTCSIYISCF